jgi:RimJ/RimL family protein N-acetyltransferase
MSEPIVTTRLTLVPATLAHAQAEIADRDTFAQLLGAQVPDNWPPENTIDALPLFLEWLTAAPQHSGWFGWYALAQEENATTLVAAGGFLGPPQDGEICFGYSVLPQFEGRGYASELAAGLVRWALAQPIVKRIAAETEWDNPASERVLEKVGFVSAGSASTPEGARFMLERSAG